MIYVLSQQSAKVEFFLEILFAFQRNKKGEDEIIKRLHLLS
jgi:hypothetical protein